MYPNLKQTSLPLLVAAFVGAPLLAAVPAAGAATNQPYQCVAKSGTTGRVFYAKDAKDLKSEARKYCAAGETPAALKPPTNPPLAADLAAIAVAVPPRLGQQVSQLTVVGGAGYRAYSTDRVERLTLTSGKQKWQASFPASGLRGGDSTPTVGISSDGATVYALRAVTKLNKAGSKDDVAGLQLIAIKASTGKLKWSKFVSDPKGRLAPTGMPPSILAANSTNLVTTANPQWGIGTAVIKLPTATIAWKVTQQGYTAGSKVALVRQVVSGKVGIKAISRTTGKQAWQLQSKSAQYFYLGQTPESFLVDQVSAGRHRVLWVNHSTGQVRTSTESFLTPENSLEFLQTRSALVYRAGATGNELQGHDLNTGRELWSLAGGSRVVPTLTCSLGDFLYGITAGAEPHGVALDARTGAELATSVAVPSILSSNPAGALIGTAAGQAWAPYPN
ncbi:MAG: PQQ-binding-like beta-propeller repeat protein [Candidatus Nanopelagicales bacterium]